MSLEMVGNDAEIVGGAAKEPVRGAENDGAEIAAREAGDGFLDMADGREVVPEPAASSEEEKGGGDPEPGVQSVGRGRNR